MHPIPWLDWALRLPAAWTPEAAFGADLAERYDFVEAHATEATQPVIADEKLENVGVGDWGTITATLSKVGSPYEGTQCLRITTTASSGYARQIGVWIVGNRYSEFGCWARGDGSGYPIFYGPDLNQVYGTSSTSWQNLVSPSAVCTDNRVLLRCVGSSQTSDYDDLTTPENLARTRYDPVSGSSGGYISQPTAANQPYWDSEGVQSEGNVNYLYSSLAASTYTVLHNGAGVTWWMVIKPNGFSRARPRAWV
jgi:hypothetical protein